MHCNNSTRACYKISCTVTKTMLDTTRLTQAHHQIKGRDLPYFTSVLLTWEGTLAAGQDPKHEVGHPEGEEDDGVTEDQGQHHHQDHGPCKHCMVKVWTRKDCLNSCWYLFVYHFLYPTPMIFSSPNHLQISI